MFKSGHLLFALSLLWLAGCATGPNKKPAAVTDWDSGEVPRPQFKPLAMQPSPEKPKSNLVWPTNDVAEAWITLDHWCQMNQLVAPVRYAVAAPATYSVNTPKGVLKLKAGSRSALWDGLELQLGFAPREAEGRLIIHILDARKNFQPLLEADALPAFGNRTIFIDPGHGGGNTGARSAFNQHFEKEYTLDWALRLKPLLETNGWKVFLPRTSDLFVTNSDRVVFAEAHHADLFLSLHFNAATQGQEQSGAETYCLTPRGMPSNLTRDFEDDPAKAFPNNAFDTQNLQYALRLHRALLAVNGHKDRGVRRARFMGVLLGQNRPAVLLEAGYLSNPTEAEQIADPAFRQKLAEAVATALR